MTTPALQRLATEQHGILTRAVHEARLARLMSDFHHDLEADRAKHADLVEAGRRVVRVTWARLTQGGKREATRFRTLLSGFPGA